MSHRPLSVKYDPKADALYVALGPGDLARTVIVDDDRLVDVDAKDTAVGIEVLGVSHGFQLTDLVERFGLQRHAAALKDVESRSFERIPRPTREA
jgi:uncharacterized protein YuzE